MPNRKLVDLFKSKGMLFPETELEVEEFEKNFCDKELKPQDWDDPIQILLRGKLEVSSINSFFISEENITSMAAREGKELSDSVRKKMLEDKKNAKK